MPNWSTMPKLVSLWIYLWLLSSLLTSTQWHGSSCCFLNMPSMLLPQSLTLTGMLFLPIPAWLTPRCLSNICLKGFVDHSKIVAIYCNCPTPYPGLFFFTAYINTCNITLFILYIFSHQILVFECVLFVKQS